MRKNSVIIIGARPVWYVEEKCNGSCYSVRELGNANVLMGDEPGASSELRFFFAESIVHLTFNETFTALFNFAASSLLVH